MCKLRFRTPMLILVVLALTSCNSQSPDSAKDDATAYIPSTDKHPCLGVSVSAPEVVKLETETMVRVDVNNRCDETVTYDGSAAPYHLQLVNNDDKTVWFTPSEAIPAIPVEYAVAADRTSSYEAPVKLPTDNVLPGDYRMIARVLVEQDTPNAERYVEPLKLESEPQNVTVGP